MANIHWIHISDIHLNKRGTQTENMREKLAPYIKDLAMKNKFDYVFFTGDIRFAPNIDFPVKESKNYFDSICKAAGIDKDHLFVVIGNHDLDRENAERISAIENVEKSYEDDDGIINEEMISHLKAGRDMFYQTIKDIVKESQYEHLTDSKTLHFRSETHDLNIIHIDSLLTYKKDQESGFILGTYALKQVLEECNPAKPVIILSHYSIDALEPLEQKSVVYLLKKYNVQLWLAGHKHTEIIYKQYDYHYVVHSGNQTFERRTTPSFVEGFLNTESGEGYFIVHRWNRDADWAVYQTLLDKTDLQYFQKKDRTMYPFVLDLWLQANGKSQPKADNDIDSVRDYIISYKGKSILIDTIERDLKIEHTKLIKILNELKKENLIKPINYRKSHWEIL